MRSSGSSSSSRRISAGSLLRPGAGVQALVDVALQERGWNQAVAHRARYQTGAVHLHQPAEAAMPASSCAQHAVMATAFGWLARLDLARALHLFKNYFP